MQLSNDDRQVLKCLAWLCEETGLTPHQVMSRLMQIKARDEATKAADGEKK